jgi:hypothetical protein
VARTTARQKVRTKRPIRVFSTNPVEMARQVKEQFEMLEAGINELNETIEQLRIVNGNATPDRVLPLRGELEFTGPGVAMTLTKQRYVATISGLASATGLDGVDLSLAAGALIGRASREVENISIGIVDQNNYPASTADWKRVTASGVVRGWTGFEAPDPVTGTQAFWFTNVSATTGISFTNDSASSSAGNKILTPGGIAYLLRPGNSALFWYDYDSDYWRIFARDWTADMPAPGVTDHGALTGLGDAADHTWATLVDGTRAFTGNQSMGGNNLTSIGQAVMANSSSQLVMTGGSIVQVDDITANGSGSVWNLVGGDLTNVDDITMGGATSVISNVGEINMSAAGIISSVAQLTMTAGSLIECNGGDITEWTDLTANGSGSTLSMAGGRIINVAYQEFDDGLTGAGTPSSATSMFAGTRAGHPHFRMGIEAFPHTGYLAAWDFQTAWNTGTALADFEIDFSDIDGKNLTDGAYEIHGWAFMCDNSSGTTSYYEHRIWHCTFTSGASTSASISERLYDGVAFHMDGRGPVYNASVSGQIATFTRNTVFGSSIRLHHYIVVYGMGGV